MRLLDRLEENLRLGGSLPRPLDLALAAATPLVRYGMKRRLNRPAVRVPGYVVSFGNLTVGGTGKTPAVIERAGRELAQGRKVAVLTRGYGSRGNDLPLISTEVDPARYAERLGDEPALLLQKLPGLIVVKDPDRVRGAYRAMNDFDCWCLILDDGFQYTALDRDENVLLIDASNPFGNGKLLPRGVLREPPEAIARATHVILTRCDQARNVPEIEEMVRQISPNVPIRRTIHAPAGLRLLAGGASMDLGELRGKRVAAVCAIGNPEAFFRTLESLGANLMDRIALPDHAPIPPGAIPSEGMVITTEKDAVRIASPPGNLYALEVALKDV